MGQIYIVLTVGEGSSLPMGIPGEIYSEDAAIPITFKKIGERYEYYTTTGSVMSIKVSDVPELERVVGFAVHEIREFNKFKITVGRMGNLVELNIFRDISHTKCIFRRDDIVEFFEAGVPLENVNSTFKLKAMDSKFILTRHDWSRVYSKNSIFIIELLNKLYTVVYPLAVCTN